MTDEEALDFVINERTRQYLYERLKWKMAGAWGDIEKEAERRAEAAVGAAPVVRETHSAPMAPQTPRERVEADIRSRMR